MWQDDVPLIHPRHKVPPPKKREQAIIYQRKKNIQNKGQKTKTNMLLHPTEMLSQHSHTVTPLSSLYTNQKCRDSDMIYVGQINKNITENLGGFKIKGPFLKMLP